MKTDRSIVFIVELLILFVILLTVTVSVTVISVKARGESVEASKLTEAVVCARNAAEITAAASDAADAADRLRNMDGTGDVTVSGSTVQASVALDGSSSKGRTYALSITVSEEPAEAGKYVEEEIRVYEDSDGRPIYTLHTGNYKEAE